jgi:hypothetical protein
MMLRKILLVTSAIVLAGWQATAQQTTSSPVSEAIVAQPPAAALVATTDTVAKPPMPAAAPAPESKEKHKKKKEEYTGPSTIVELPPTPMLDDQGIQRLDPDGKPMWNTPIKQQRDKHGHPLFTAEGKPVFQTATDLGYDEHGKKLHVKKVKPPKMIPVSIERGTMTVDGMTGKAALNYDIPDLKYIYLYAPGIGVAVVSNEPFPGATEQKNAFSNNTLTVTIEDHTLQLASDKRMLSKKPEAAYVLVDRGFKLPSIFPVMGYGTVRKAPYAWPGAKPNVRLADDAAPPPPADLMPTQLLTPCPTGQMRRAGPTVLPGQTAPPQPCIPIKSVTKQASVAPKKTTATPETTAEVTNRMEPAKN